MADARRVCPTCGAGYGGTALFCPLDGAPLGSRQPGSLTDPFVGFNIDGQIRLERLAGLGSMGRVYRAHQESLERAVAVKILHREHSKNETLVARFRREGRVAGGLVHPNVVAVHSAGELPVGGQHTDGEPYLVMEFLDGLSLRSALAAGGGALSIERALRVVIQISDAMGEAHAHGVVHRDLKPENVMLVACGADPDFVKVLDFGVARVGEADSSVATHAGAILGTATYACPESARGDRVGPEGDVYAIATLLFECLAGRPPFQGPGSVDVLIQHAEAPAPDVRSVSRASDVPAEISALIARNLAKNPADRAPNGREFGRALFDAVRSTGRLGETLFVESTLLGNGRAVSAVSAVSSVSTASRSGETTRVLATAVERSTLRNLTAKAGGAT